MRPDHYILDGSGNPIFEPDVIKWAQWFEKTECRRVAKERIGDSEISTVFLGLDHNFGAEGPPVLWETMVFGGKLNGEEDRCGGSREQAEAMHQAMVQRVK